MTQRNEGIIVSGGSISAAQIVVGPRATATTMHVGAGSNVNVDSRLAAVQQSANGSGHDSQDLQALLKNLTRLLQSAPADKLEQADAVSTQAAQLIEAAARQRPNRVMLRTLINGLKEAAAFLRDSLPDAVGIAGQIVGIVAKLHGIGV